uniref:Uncharacterized protein n=1 Tax=Physcomitrium patens TaxID=3218 RepID=A0A7I3Z0T8_PHYPA
MNLSLFHTGWCLVERSLKGALNKPHRSKPKDRRSSWKELPFTPNDSKVCPCNAPEEKSEEEALLVGTLSWMCTNAFSCQESYRIFIYV